MSYDNATVQNAETLYDASVLREGAESWEEVPEGARALWLRWSARVTEGFRRGTVGEVEGPPLPLRGPTDVERLAEVLGALDDDGASEGPPAT